VNPGSAKRPLRPLRSRGPTLQALIWGADLLAFKQRLPLAWGGFFPGHGCQQLISVSHGASLAAAWRVAAGCCWHKGGLGGSGFQRRADSFTDLGGAIFPAPTSVMADSRAPTCLQLSCVEPGPLWRDLRQTNLAQGGPAGCDPA